MIRLGNNYVLKSLTKILTFVDADANGAAEGGTIALRERCSGELKTDANCKYFHAEVISLYYSDEISGLIYYGKY